MSIAANKHSDVRAALCHDPYTAHQARAHNDANVLCMGTWVVSPERVWLILDEWFKTPFEGGRHVKRVRQLEVGYFKTKEPVKMDLAPVRFGVALSPGKSVFSPLLYPGELAAGLAAAADQGLECVELSLRAPFQPPFEALEKMLQDHNLSVAAFATGQSCLHDSLCLAQQDKALREASVERLKSHIDYAARLQAKVIVGGIRGRLEGTVAKQAEQRAGFVAALTAVAAYAGEKNVEVLLEPINRYETNLVNTLADGLAVVEEVGADNLKLLADTFHMNLEEPDIHKSLRAAGDRLGYVHFADSNREAPGRGHLDFRSILGTLLEMGYQGPIVAEVLPLPDDPTAMAAVGKFVRSLKSPQGK
jgi:sugar phosphate isomerase/epimerase